MFFLIFWQHYYRWVKFINYLLSLWRVRSILYCSANWDMSFCNCLWKFTSAKWTFGSIIKLLRNLCCKLVDQLIFVGDWRLLNKLDFSCNFNLLLQTFWLLTPWCQLWFLYFPLFHSKIYFYFWPKDTIWLMLKNTTFLTQLRTKSTNKFKFLNKFWSQS